MPTDHKDRVCIPTGQTILLDASWRYGRLKGGWSHQSNKEPELNVSICSSVTGIVKNEHPSKTIWLISNEFLFSYFASIAMAKPGVSVILFFENTPVRGLYILTTKFTFSCHTASCFNPLEDAVSKLFIDSIF